MTAHYNCLQSINRPVNCLWQQWKMLVVTVLLHMADHISWPYLRAPWHSPCRHARAPYWAAWNTRLHLQYMCVLHPAEMLLANMKGCGMAVSSLGHAAPAGMILTDFDDYLTEAEDSWERVWTWFAGKPELDGAQLLLKVSQPISPTMQPQRRPWCHGLA